jgi:hypothetical protein
VVCDGNVEAVVVETLSRRELIRQIFIDCNGVRNCCTLRSACALDLVRMMEFQQNKNPSQYNLRMAGVIQMD